MNTDYIHHSHYAEADPKQQQTRRRRGDAIPPSRNASVYGQAPRLLAPATFDASRGPRRTKHSFSLRSKSDGVDSNASACVVAASTTGEASALAHGRHRSEASEDSAAQCSAAEGTGHEETMAGAAEAIFLQSTSLPRKFRPVCSSLRDTQLVKDCCMNSASCLFACVAYKSTSMHSGNNNFLTTTRR